jgi:hypothetical protein
LKSILKNATCSYDVYYRLTKGHGFFFLLLSSGTPCIYTVVWFILIVNLKRIKHRGLGRGYNYVPFGVETLGPSGPSAQKLFVEIAKRLRGYRETKRNFVRVSSSLSLELASATEAEIHDRIRGCG